MIGAERLNLNPRKRLPESANPRSVYHEQTGRVFPTPSFVALLNRRIQKLLETRQVSSNSSGQALFDQAIILYADVAQRDVPVYERSVRNLEKLARTIGPNRLVMYGRDTDYLAMAVTAHEYGRPKVIGRPILLSISREIGWSIGSFPDRLEMMRRLFEQHGITSGFIHVDIGKYGNVPSRIIKGLWPDFTDEEVNARVRLVDPHHLKRVIWQIRREHLREHLSGNDERRALKEAISDPRLRPIEGIGEISELHELLFQQGYEVIEDRPHTTQQAKALQEDPITKKVRIVKHPSSASQQLLAWTVGQAVTRHFLPDIPRQRLPWLKSLKRKFGV